MESGSIIFGLVVVIGIVLPIVIQNGKRKKKEKQYFNILTGIAEKNSCTISEHELWIKGAIGIDKAAQQLFFMKKTANDEILQVVNLAEMQKCRVVNTHRIVNIKESDQKVIEKLELAFSNREPRKPDVFLEFYNTSRDNLTLNGEVQLTEKWADIANKSIARTTQKK